MQDKGLGDTVHRVLSLTGIPYIAKAVGAPCGCEERREKLNKMVPYESNNKR